MLKHSLLHFTDICNENIPSSLTHQIAELLRDLFSVIILMDLIHSYNAHLDFKIT